LSGGLDARRISTQPVNLAENKFPEGSNGGHQAPPLVIFSHFALVFPYRE
jgi:hypothetical protein